jgi:hypothetical protein
MVAFNHPYMSTLEERMGEFIRETGWTVTQIAATAKVSPSAVSQWLGKGTKTIHAIGNIEAAINLERESGYSALWLAKGKGPKKVPGRVGPSPTLESALQLIGQAIAHAPDNEARQGAVAMLVQYIGNPPANVDLLPLILRRLSGEITGAEAVASQRAA